MPVRTVVRTYVRVLEACVGATVFVIAQKCPLTMNDLLLTSPHLTVAS